MPNPIDSNSNAPKPMVDSAGAGAAPSGLVDVYAQIVNQIAQEVVAGMNAPISAPLAVPQPYPPARAACLEDRDESSIDGGFDPLAHEVVRAASAAPPAPLAAPQPHPPAGPSFSADFGDPFADVEFEQPAVNRLALFIAQQVEEGSPKTKKALLKSWAQNVEERIQNIEFEQNLEFSQRYRDADRTFIEKHNLLKLELVLLENLLKESDVQDRQVIEEWIDKVSCGVEFGEMYFKGHGVSDKKYLESLSALADYYAGLVKSAEDEVVKGNLTLAEKQIALEVSCLVLAHVCGIYNAATQYRIKAKEEISNRKELSKASASARISCNRMEAAMGQAIERVGAPVRDPSAPSMPKEQADGRASPSKERGERRVEISPPTPEQIVSFERDETLSADWVSDSEYQGREFYTPEIAHIAAKENHAELENERANEVVEVLVESAPVVKPLKSALKRR